MKIRIFVTLALVLACSTFSFAQGFHFGLKGGVNLYKIDGQSFRDGFTHSYNAGLFSEINFDKKWGIQPELLWNQTQTRTSSEFDDIYDEGFSELKDVKLDYLSIPLLLSYRASDLLTFQAGPQFGILINNNSSLLQNGKDAFKGGDVSLLGGLQLNIGGMKIGGRYVTGLTNINNIDSRDEWRNNGFQLYLGFRIL